MLDWAYVDCIANGPFGTVNSMLIPVDFKATVQGDNIITENDVFANYSDDLQYHSRFA